MEITSIKCNPVKRMCKMRCKKECVMVSPRPLNKIAQYPLNYNTLYLFFMMEQMEQVEQFERSLKSISMKAILKKVLGDAPNCSTCSTCSTLNN